MRTSADTSPVGRICVVMRSAVLWIYLAAVVLPMIWVLATSVKSTQEIYADPFGVPKAATSAKARAYAVENYRKAWIGSGFSRYFVNSVKVTLISLALVLIMGSMAAYALARFEFRLNSLLYGVFLSGLLIPMQLILIPLFFQYSALSRWLTALLAPPVRWLGLGELTVNLHDTHAGLIMIYVAASLPFTVFVLTAFFRTLPGELREAALMDGAGEYRTFWSVMMPIARPGLVTAAIFNFLGLWNEYLFGLVFLSSDRLKTLPLGLQAIGMQAQYKSDFGLLFAALVIAMVPTLLVYAVLQERLTQGITAGAVKG
jgi:ABC-type glycerol-3-phosphate transport system permease component